MFKLIPTLLCDFYKISHRIQYPKNTTLVYSNFTPRNGKYYKGFNKKVKVFGIQYVIKSINDLFKEEFFNQALDKVLNDYSRVVKYCLNTANPDTEHIKQLWQLQFLPLEFNALPEGSLVNYGVPVLTIKNTHPDFFWLVNFLETWISSDLWMMCNNATLANDYRKLCDNYALKTCDNNSHVDFQCHDFSFRGMGSKESAMLSGMAHLSEFKGTDTIPAILAMEYYYGKNIENELVGTSIPASEHSVMCAGGKNTELETYRRFITELYPTGLVSIVSDTWDFWAVLTDILPQLQDKIMARDGKVVIRPDSGDPVDIICGTDRECIGENYLAEQKGAIEVLWDLFGGTINEKDYKVLDSHIGLIYGDSITLERAQEIFRRLEAKRFASSNVTFGIGSYTYQYNTRDSQGWAMKATYCEVDGKGIEIFKEPRTDTSKKSAKGLLRVEKIEDNFILHDCQTIEQEKQGELKTVFLNGKII